LGLGQEKKARLQRKLATAYDRVVIGPASVPDAEASDANARASESQRSVKAHWRRGHFRTILYGETRIKPRLGWIKPVWSTSTPGRRSRP